MSVVENQPKIALITGGSRGLGRNTAINLARKGVVMITISLVELARFLDLIWTLCPEPLGAARERSHAADELFSTLRTALDHL